MREASERRTVKDTDSYAFLHSNPQNADERMTEAQVKMQRKLIFSFLIAFFVSLSGGAQEVYVPTSQGDIAQLNRALITGNKTGGKSFLAIYGAKLTTSLVIDGKHSKTILPKTSTVFFVFKPAGIPIEAFKLVKLKERMNKGFIFLTSKQDKKTIDALVSEISKYYDEPFIDGEDETEWNYYHWNLYDTIPDSPYIRIRPVHSEDGGLMMTWKV